MDEDGLIPEGWTSADLGDVLEPSKEKVDPLKIGEVPYIGLEHIDKGTGNLLDSGSSSEVRSTKSVFHEGDLLYGKLRPYLNKVYLARFDGICSTDILVYPEQELISNAFFFYRMLSGDFVRYTSGNVSGVQHPRVNVKTISQFDLLVPPLNEQHRIVTKIEELFTNLDAGVEAMKMVHAQIKRYRQAVLKYAFQGKLTAEWREAHKDEVEPASVLLERIREERKKKLGGKYKEPPAVDTSDLPELPDGWDLAQLGSISTKIVDGTHHTPTYVPNGVPFLSVKDVRNGEVFFDNCKYITMDEHKELIKRCQPEKDDILITKSGTIGRIAVNRTDKEFSLFVSVALIKPLANFFLSDYLAFALMHYINQINIQQVIKGGVIKNFHLEDLRLVVVPVAPIAEQQKIVLEVAKHFSVADAITKVVEQSIMQSDRLRQSILKRAFEGKLVPQDPNDEPADELLERIKEERSSKVEESEKSKSKKRS